MVNFPGARNFACLFMALCALLSAAALTAAPLAVSYPGTFSPKDHRSGYYVQLLDLALRKSGAEYALQPASATTAEFVHSVEEDLDVSWAPSTREYEEKLRAIRIPLDKGILGWRLFLVKSRDVDAFKSINTLQQLQARFAGQQRLWSDVDILRANGLPVVEGSDYFSLFNMLAGDRFQYFPRGVGEIWGEAENSAGLGLVVEPHLALHYPVNTYFFVARDRGHEQLARLIEQGLLTAIKDGSFDKLFEQYNGAAVRQAHLRTRTVFELRNPLQPTSQPLVPNRPLEP